MAAPQATIVIPTYARADKLAACLDGIARLDRDVPFEIVVVDDGSPEPVAPVAEAYADALDVRCLRQDNAGPAAARNRGAAAAGGRWLAFTDDDCEPEPGWLTAIVRALEAQPDALVGGHTVNAVEGDVYAETAQDLVGFLYEHAGSEDGRGGQGGFDFFTSNNLACAKDAFTALGGFDESFPLAAGEDRDFGLRFKAAGGPLVFVPGAVMRHHHAMSLARFFRQQRNYGRGAFHLRARMTESGGEPVPFEGLRFYAGMMSYPFRRRAPDALVRSALLGLSQAAMVAGFAQEAMQRRGGGGGVV